MSFLLCKPLLVLILTIDGLILGVKGEAPQTGVSPLEPWTPDELIPNGYLKSQPPPPTENGSAVNVEMSLTVNQIISVNEVEQSFTMEATLEQFWTDTRLKVPTGFEHITLDASWKSKLWTPQPILMNLLQSASSSIETVPTYIEVSNGSQVMMFTRRIVKLQCVMDLFLFPQDTQKCHADITSVMYHKDKINYKWRSFLVAPLVEYSKFEIPTSYNETCISLRGQEFPCLRAEVKLYRRLSYYCIRIYAPSFLLVITSFVGFWIPVMGWPARVAVVVTPLLSLITQQTQINSEINVSYVVALHIWMMFCIFFTFMALIEYALAIVYWHSVDEKKERANQEPIGIINGGGKTDKVSHWIKNALIKIYGYVDWTKCPQDRNKVDYCARVLFPVLFVAFVIIYILVFVVPWAADKY